ncbi:hypothetical protein RhiirB3_388083 [Rhizophagus irregularis]|nr:hypothetical protein RhiirB3_388083 [Rhizophagus irregularis]
MRNLDLNDNAMDIDTASFGEKVELREKDGDVYMSSPNKTAVSSSSVPLKGKATPVKIPVKVTGSKSTPAKAVTKNDLLSLLRSADFRKLLREILQEEMMSARKVTEISDDLAEEEQEEDIREYDPMDIDIARLENTKDLLALDGEREAAEELGLDIDKSITYNISGTLRTEMLKAQVEELTKNFQAQFKQLQASKPVRKLPVYRQQIKPVRPKSRPRVVQQEDDDYPDPDWDDPLPDVGDDPDAPAWTLDDHQNAINLIMGYKRGTSKILTNQLQKAKDRRDDLDLA